MLLYNIRNYDDFQNLFGMEVHGNGVKSRANKILLNHLKSRSLIHWCREHDDYTLLRLRNMADLKKTVLVCIQEQGKQDPTLPHKVVLIGKTYWSGKYRTDEQDGICEDFDKKSVRYINIERNRDFKMKAGKFFSAILQETALGQALSESTRVYLSEEFASDWQTYTFGRTPEVTLHVDNDFEKIYDEYYCKAFNGCSCMVGRDRHSFYEDSVEAKAAYITDKEGFVLARAILYTEVTDQDGKKWRLLERQYARESNEVLKRTLIDLLIKGNYIDAYKQVGAGCGDARAFVDLEGNSLSHMKFSISCELGTCDVLSYQDSFKWYNYDRNVANNYSEAYHDYTLDTTDYNLDGDSDEDEEDDDTQYDDYHDYNCRETRLCYENGREVYVDVDNLDDFIFMEALDEYHHEDDVTECVHCGKKILKADATEADAIDGYFCDDDCLTSYKKENWHYAAYDDDYFPEEDDITTINTWDEQAQSYQPITISCACRDYLIREHCAFGHGETWFVGSDHITAIPA